MNFLVDGVKLTFPNELLNSKSFMVQSIPKPYSVTMDDDPNPCTKINAQLAQNPKNILIIDEKVFDLYGKDIHWPENKIFKAPATETFKAMEGVMRLYDFLYAHAITKGETLVVVGGGIIQDISAFVASTYKRGINWVHFPTTLLAMSDSCIGGKAGVNYKGSKNQLALFSSPHGVIINPIFIETLDPKDVQSGLGEILKLCISGGREGIDFFIRSVEAGVIKDKKNYTALITHALGIKKAVIEMDEFEQNIRKGLNYGHTIGHVIEAMTYYNIPHGIAVVTGMIIVNQMSFEMGLLSQEDCQFINNLCLSLIDQQSLEYLQTIDTQEMMHRLRQDKKVSGDQVTFVMLQQPGALAFVKVTMDQNLENQMGRILGQFFRN